MDISFKTEEGRFNYRVCGIIIHDNKILAMHDEKSPYYYLPGGRVQLNETVEEADEESELEKAARIAKERRSEEGRSAHKDEYVSKFEEIAGTAAASEEKQSRSKKRTEEKEERRRPTYDISKKDYEMKPIYSDEELAEIEAEFEDEESRSWIHDDDIDFDEYDEYYD